MGSGVSATISSWLTVGTAIWRGMVTVWYRWRIAVRFQVGFHQSHVEFIALHISKCVGILQGNGAMVSVLGKFTPGARARERVLIVVVSLV